MAAVLLDQLGLSFGVSLESGLIGDVDLVDHINGRFGLGMKALDGGCAECGARQDLLSANDLKDDAYGMLWHFLARARMGQDGTAELSANAARLKTKDWVYPVIDFYLGRRSLDDMRAAAIRSDQKCKAAFYAGEWHLLRGDKAETRALRLRSNGQSCALLSLSARMIVSRR
jgi:hypothetical protein